MPDATTETLGIAASAIGVFAFLPQLVDCMRSEVPLVSPYTFSILIVALVLWIAFSIRSKDQVLLWSSLIQMVMYIAILVRTLTLIMRGKSVKAA